MKTTSLTVGGFNQLAVARSLIELPGNAEKGLSQWFLWLFPRPVYGNFESLGTIDTVFTGKLVHTTFCLLNQPLTGVPHKIWCSKIFVYIIFSSFFVDYEYHQRTLLFIYFNG